MKYATDDATRTDLSYRPYKFTASLGKGDNLEQFVSPIEDGIDREQWDAMSDEDKEDWLYNAVADWSLNHLQTSWS